MDFREIRICKQLRKLKKRKFSEIDDNETNHNQPVPKKRKLSNAFSSDYIIDVSETEELCNEIYEFINNNKDLVVDCDCCYGCGRWINEDFHYDMGECDKCEGSGNTLEQDVFEILPI